MNQTITYIVLAHGEDSVFSTINNIIKYKDKDDKIIVLADPTSEEYAKKLKRMPLKLVQHVLEKDYSAHRNFVLDKVNTSYMVWLDADECLSDNLQKNIKTILESNNPDAIWCARLNLFDGVKPMDALMYGWTLQGNICNYPDLQCRIFKAKKGIRFVGKLHERPKLEKHHKVIKLPINEDLHIIHTKTIETQLKDNLRYNTEFSQRDNAGITTKELLQ